MDNRYFRIKINNIKDDMDAILEWVEMDDEDRTLEYINDSIETLEKLKQKL